MHISGPAPAGSPTLFAKPSIRSRSQSQSQSQHLPAISHSISGENGEGGGGGSAAVPVVGTASTGPITQQTIPADRISPSCSGKNASRSRAPPLARARTYSNATTALLGKANPDAHGIVHGNGNVAGMRSRAQSNAAIAQQQLQQHKGLFDVGSSTSPSSNTEATTLTPSPAPIISSTNANPRAGAGTGSGSGVAASTSSSRIAMAEEPTPLTSLEQKAAPNHSSSYGHHRQTSIVHGSVHSRNASYNMAFLGRGSSPPPPLPTSPIPSSSSPGNFAEAAGPGMAAAAISAVSGATDFGSSQPSPNPDFDLTVMHQPSPVQVQQNHRYLMDTDQPNSPGHSTGAGIAGQGGKTAAAGGGGGGGKGGGGSGGAGGGQPMSVSLTISNRNLNANHPSFAPDREALDSLLTEVPSRGNQPSGVKPLLSNRKVRSGSIPQGTHGQNSTDRQRSVHIDQDQSQHQPQHQLQHQRQNSQDVKTVGEYALHHLFNLFVGQANDKTDECLRLVGRHDRPVEAVCGPGADPAFDQLIAALGHIARNKPKPLIDTIMIWRKAKAEAATAAKQGFCIQQKNQSGSSQHSQGGSQHSFHPLICHSSSANSTTSKNNGLSLSYHNLPDISSMQVNPSLPAIIGRPDVLAADRRATVSVYLVCRVLIEIFNQCTLEVLTSEMADRLEDIIFGQLKAVDSEQIANSPLRMANWRIYGELLGVMCEKNSTSVTSRFLTDLSQNHRDSERSEILIFGMRHIPIKTQPPAAFQNSCDFLLSLARIIISCRGQRLKNAYYQILELFILPIATDLSCDLANAKYREFYDLLFPRIAHSISQPRNWPATFPLYSLLLCTASQDVFANNFIAVIGSLATKLKEKPTREAALTGLCQLVWAYLYRFPDSMGSMSKRIDEIVKLAFPSGKRTYLTTETATIEPLTQLVRIIGHKFPEICFRNVIFPLVNSETILTSAKDYKIENMEPEKMTVAIRLFLAVMTDLNDDSCDETPFPQDISRPEPEPFVSFQFPVRAWRDAHGPSSRLELHEDADCLPPFKVDKLPTNLRQLYFRFCEILGKIAILCDNTFGVQAALDERSGGTIPKTPLTEAFGFGRRDDHGGERDQKQAFYDLFYVAIQALLRCLSDHIPLKPLINLLCTGTAHRNSKIAASSATSLKAIARQSHAQQVTIGFARFIFDFDTRYATVSDDGLLGPGRIESTLELYVDLIRIWTEEFKRKTRDSVGQAEKNASGARGAQLDLSGVFAHVDEIEGHGLFFLCFQSPTVRAFAVALLKLVTEFDKAIGKEHTRIIHLLQGGSEDILDVRRDVLSTAERSRLERAKSKGQLDGILLQLCGSDTSYDTSLWMKLFPNVIKASFDRCPFAVTLGREFVCARLVHIHKNVSAIADSAQTVQGLNNSISISAFPHDPLPVALVEQWKLYLIMACATLTQVGAQSQSQLANAQHVRKNSKGEKGSIDKISSARSLFAFVIPLLSASPDAIRDAIVVALGSINKTMYRTLLESLQYAVTMCNEEARVRVGAHHRTPSMPRRNPQTDLLRTEVTNVYRVTAHFLQDPEVHSDEWIISNIVTYSRDVRLFLNDAEVQNDPDFQRLRTFYCGLVEELLEGINKTDNPARWMSCESRKSTFALMEEWCGYSPNQPQIAQREEYMRKVALSRQRELWETRSISTIENEKRNLRTAALSAMASLCGGPVRVITASSAVLQFDIRRLLSWIDILLNTASDQLHEIGRRALKNLISYNLDINSLMEHCVEMCYHSQCVNTLESYFEVTMEILTNYDRYALPYYRILGVVLLMLGNPHREIRVKSAHLLRALEGGQCDESTFGNFEIGVSDGTTTVYKLAQKEMSAQLARQYPELAFVMVSEFCLHFRNVQSDTQRNMVEVILPWIRSVELQTDPNGRTTSVSYALLANLFEITVRYSSVLSDEVQLLWQGLTVGPYGGNVQLVLDFLILLSLEYREQLCIEHAKQIVVFLSKTQSASQVIDFLFLQITPRNMICERQREPRIMDTLEINELPYVTDMSTILPTGNRQISLSLGQLSFIFLVNLMVTPVMVGIESITKLVHLSLILWDHFWGILREEAREMLIHLIHELVISRMQNVPPATRVAMEQFLTGIRRGDDAVTWKYEYNRCDGDQEVYRVPPSMLHVTTQVVNYLSVVSHDASKLWANEALLWATSCSVRHLACRSFQIFRCISTSIESQMLADMLARLSNTIAEQKTDFLTFSMEILTTLKIVIVSLPPTELLRYPQLFWATCACLNTIHEREYMEGIGMLEEYIESIDLTDPAILTKLVESKPAKWEGIFRGIQSLTYMGLKSSSSFERIIRLIHKLILLPNHELIGDDNRLLFAILANLPGFLYQFDVTERQTEVYEHATRLAQVAEDQRCPEIADCLSAFTNGYFRSSKEFLIQIKQALRLHFFASQETQSFVFLIGLLTNATSWFRVKLLDILSVILSDIDMSRPEIACHGFDALGPLFRLLRTDLCGKALEVLDHIMTVSGNPLDKHYLRMSMTSSSASRTARQEFDTIESLYGIPEVTGWSVPCPAVQSSLTRHNVFAVFCTCADEAKEGIDMQASDPSHDDSLPIEEFNDPYYPVISDDMKSVGPRSEPDMQGLLQKLDSLDDFFEDASDDINPLALDDTALRALASFRDANANLYDQQTAPLLRKSLGRRPSTSSFHNGLAECSNQLSTDREDFNFHTGNGSADSADFFLPQQQRTSLHQRSVTSPAAKAYYHDGLTAADDLAIDASSDPQLVSQTASYSPQQSQTQMSTAYESLSNSDGDDAVLYDSDDQSVGDYPFFTQQTQDNLPSFASQPTDSPVSLESVSRNRVQELTGNLSKEKPMRSLKDQLPRANNGLEDVSHLPQMGREFSDGGHNVRSVPTSPRA